MQQQQQSQNGQVNRDKQANPSQKSAQGAKPVNPETTKVENKDKKSGDSCGC